MPIVSAERRMWFSSETSDLVGGRGRGNAVGVSP
jgi:hypothetical protein